MNLDKMMIWAKRVYNQAPIVEKDKEGKVLFSDEEAIKKLCSKVFDSNGKMNNFEDFRSFNALLVKVADEVAEGRVEQILTAVSNYEKVGRYDMVMYNIPKKAKVTAVLSATASGVDFTRIAPHVTKIPATPRSRQFGAYYNIDKLISDPINEFKNAVNLIAEAKVKFIYKQVMKLGKESQTGGKIPSSQFYDGTGISWTQFKAIENKLLRYGSKARPIILADMNFIEYLALKQVGTVMTGQITDTLQDELLRDVSISAIGRSVAIATDNPFIDRGNSKVELDVSQALMLAGGSKSPFEIREFGEMRVKDELPDIEDEVVRLKIDFKLDVTLLRGEAMAYIEDDSVTL